MRRIPTTYTSTQSLSLDVSHFPKFSKVLHAGDDLGDPNNIITFILFLWIIIYKFTPNCKKKEWKSIPEYKYLLLVESMFKYRSTHR